MEINNISGLPLSNETKNKAEKRQDIPVSFQEYMHRRLQQADAQVSDIEASSVEPLYGTNEIEIVAARSRIHRNTGGDVTAFLGLVQTQSFLLDGVDLSNLAEVSASSGISGSADIQSLRERYDLSSMPPEKQAELVSELVAIKMIGISDAQKLQLSVSPDNDDLMGYLKTEAGFKDVSSIDPDNPAARLEAMIHNEHFTYDHVLERYGKHASSVLELADSHKRVLDTLKKI